MEDLNYSMKAIAIGHRGQHFPLSILLDWLSELVAGFNYKYVTIVFAKSGIRGMGSFKFRGKYQMFQ